MLATFMAGRLTVEPFNDTVTVEPGESLLQGLIRNGRNVRYGCKHGGCGTCRAQLVSGTCRIGEQTKYSLSDAKRASGLILLCATYLEEGDAVVDISKTMDIAHSKYMDGKQVEEAEVEVMGVEQLSPNVRRIVLEPRNPSEIRFMAGQYIELQIPDSDDEWRDFSLSSAPSERHRFELLIKLRPGGRLSSAIADGAITAGVKTQIRGPLGQFRMRRSHRPKVLIASGSGMAPIRAMLYELSVRKNKSRVMFFYGAENINELILMDEIRELEDSSDWLEFIPVVKKYSSKWKGTYGLITDALERRVLSLRGREVYLCGAPTLIDPVSKFAEAKGCKPRHIFLERFVPSG